MSSLLCSGLSRLFLREGACWLVGARAWLYSVWLGVLRGLNSGHGPLRKAGGVTKKGERKCVVPVSSCALKLKRNLSCCFRKWSLSAIILLAETETARSRRGSYRPLAGHC